MAPREPRRSSYQRGYTKRWALVSRLFRSKYPLCGMRPDHERPVMSQCFDEHLVTAATLTDHVVPHRGDQILFWDEGNWQSMCGTCHKKKTDAGL
jgi:5-methylcytosine-specific restriction protein A